MMLLFVQSFSLHAHIPEGHDDHHADDHHSHVHSHVLTDLHDAHLDLEHDEDTVTETQGTFSNQIHLFKYFVFTFLIVVPTVLFVWNVRNTSRVRQRLRYLFQLRPPLRAPPL
jgi:hypothetical protein